MDYKDMAMGVDSTYWYFSGKNDMLESLANKYLQDKGGLKILNIGCGSGDDIHILGRFGMVFCVERFYDIANYLLSNGFDNITLADAQMLGFKSEAFDCVVILDVLEHLKDDSSAMREIYRVLKKNGVAIVSVPAHQFLWSGHDTALGHLRRYSKRSLQSLIARNFSIGRITFWNSILFYPVAAIRIYHRLTKSDNNNPDVAPLPKSINLLLTFLLKFENRILGYVNSPCGISIFTIIYKR